MKTSKKATFKLIGLRLRNKTTNKNNQAAIDCGNLWQKFENENFLVAIPNKVSNDIYAVYYDYESNFKGTYSYFIGCQVSKETAIPIGLDELIIPEQNYLEFVAKGKIPQCIADLWRKIWKDDTQLNRAYQFDYELYSEKSKNWEKAEVSVFLSVKND